MSAAPEKKSERVVVGLAGTNADRVLDTRDKDLAVADLAGLGGSLDCTQRLSFVL